MTAIMMILACDATGCEGGLTGVVGWPRMAFSLVSIYSALAAPCCDPGFDYATYARNDNPK
jgi:hypothetical protein